MEKRKAHVFLILAICIWGSSFIASKIALRSFSPLLLCFLRFAVSSAAMLLMRFFKGSVQKPSGKDWKYLLLSSLCGISLYYTIESLALSRTSAADASLISAVYPLITILIGLLFFHLQVSQKEVIGIVLGVAGVILLTASSNREDSSVLGNLLIAFNGCLWAMFNYMTQKISKDMDDFSITYLQTMTGTVFFIPLVFLEKPAISNISLSSVLAVLYLSLICSLSALFLYNAGLRQISAARAASLMNLMPVAGVILSVSILSESVSFRHILGGALIIFGVLLSARE